VASSGTTFIPNFMKVSQLVQELEGEDTQRQNKETEAG
jgi:hypothetical protein